MAARRITGDARRVLITLVQELQASWRSYRAILATLMETHGCTEVQARQIIRDAKKAWTEVIDNDPGKARHVEALGRIAKRAEDEGKYSAAVRALAELAKVMGLYEAQKVEVSAPPTDDADRKR